MTCPRCQEAAPCHGHRRTRVVSLLGDLSLRRAYYYCGRCGTGCFPFDAEAGLGPHRLTPGAERVVSLLGTTCDAFEEAAQAALPEACGLRLSESTAQRPCEDAGARLGQLLAVHAGPVGPAVAPAGGPGGQGGCPVGDRPE